MPALNLVKLKYHYKDTNSFNAHTHIVLTKTTRFRLCRPWKGRPLIIFSLAPMWVHLNFRYVLQVYFMNIPWIWDYKQFGLNCSRVNKIFSFYHQIKSYKCSEYTKKYPLYGKDNMSIEHNTCCDTKTRPTHHIKTARFHICLPVVFLQKWISLLIKSAIYSYDFIVNHSIP